VTVAEISFGVAWLAHRGAARKSGHLGAWLSDLLVFHANRVLPVDDRVALRSGQLLARARANGVDVGVEDALIAATADLNRMAVLTRNARHFEPMGVVHTNPFDRLPPDAAP
jgi:predicted nucleic acid-binding protein